MNDVTIIIPVYNDQESVNELCLRINEIHINQVKFLIVDNGSLRKIEMPSTKNASLIRTESNLGFGGGILFGIESTKTEIVGWMPGNLKIDPHDAAEIAVETMISDHEIIKCKRRRIGFLPKAKTFAAGLIQTILLRRKMFDTGGTPTFAHISFINKMKNPPTDYVFESYVLYFARSQKINVIRPSIEYGIRKNNCIYRGTGYIQQEFPHLQQYTICWEWMLCHHQHIL